MINSIIFWVLALIERLGYLGLAFGMFIENIFPPIPSELIMPFGGFLAAEGRMNMITLIIAGTIASFLGTLPFYFLGYYGDKLVVDKFLKGWGKYLFITEDEVDKGIAFFKKYGKGATFFGRLVPIVRSVISFPAGLTKMSIYEFSIFSLLGTALWTTLLCVAGYILGDNWREVASVIDKYQHLVIIVGIFMVVLFILYTLNKLRKQG